MSFLTSLPVGVIIDGEVRKNFSLRKLKALDIKEINNEEYKSDHPVEWMGRTISTVVESIGDVPIHSEFFRTKRIGDIVKRLSIIDINYLFLVGHINSLGESIEGVVLDCPLCGKSKLKWDLNLSSVIPPEECPPPDFTFEINLKSGYVHTAPNASDINLKDVVWNKYVFRLPTYGDLLFNESHFNRSSKSNFSEKVLFCCLEKVISSDGEEMETHIKNMININLLLKLEAYDYKLISKKYNEVTPGYTLDVPTECSNCGREVNIPVSPNFLYIA